MSRLLSYVLMVVGVLFLAHAAYDEHRGVARASSPGRSSVPYTVRKDEKPEEFRNLMTYEWIRGVVVLAGGWIILGFLRRADQLDPFSPNFAGQADLDELNDILTEEQKKRKAAPPDTR